MIKSKIIKLFAMTLVMCAALSFIACGGNGAGGGDDSSSGSGSGSGGGNEGTPGTFGITSEQKAKLDALNGWEVQFSHSWSETGEEPTEEIQIFGEKDNIFWYQMDGNKAAIKKAGGKAYTYSWDEDTLNYVESTGGVGLDEELYDSLTDACYIWLYYKDYMALSGDFTAAGSENICGRPCTKYRWTNSAVALTQYAYASITFWVDNATGMTLKMESQAQSNEGSTSYSHVATVFKTGSQVTAPYLPDPEPVD